MSFGSSAGVPGDRLGKSDPMAAAVVGRGTVVCGDSEREKVVYLSATNVVELELIRPATVPVAAESDNDDALSKTAAYFLLYYESKCPLFHHSSWKTPDVTVYLDNSIRISKRYTSQ